MFDMQRHGIAFVLLAYFMAVSTVEGKAYDSVNKRQLARSGLVSPLKRSLNGPVFSSNLYTKTIADTYPVGSQVLTVTASDADQDVIIIMKGDAETRKFFYLNPETGAMILRNSLDKTFRKQFMFTVIAYVNRPQTVQKKSYAIVIINILRDKGDLKGEIRYRLDGFVPGSNVFRLDEVTGAIISRGDLLLNSSFTSITELRLLVTAFDTLAPAAEVTEPVTITRFKKNLFAPLFYQTNYEVTVYGTIPIGYIIVQVSAYDNDATHLENQIQYTLLELNAIFLINPLSGIITSRRRLKSEIETGNNYTMRVMAVDSGYPPRYATANVVVKVHEPLIHESNM